MNTRYDKTPVVGYGEGLVISDVAPIVCVTQFNDGRPENVSHWFRIEGATRARYFNVHPYRSDLGGYPVRWIENFPPEGWEPEINDLDLMCGESCVMSREEF
jgi:hypothetical protein